MEFIDTLKGVLMLLVVFGHIALPSLNKPPLLSFLYEGIYLFHMPLFVFVSGYLAKSIYRGNKLRVSKILTLVLLAFLFKAILFVIDDGSSLRNFVNKLLYFQGTPWYLFSLASWYCLVPFFERVKPVCAVALSIALGLLVGLYPAIGDILSLSRTLVFLPFFLCGYYCQQDQLLRFKSNDLVRVVSVALSIGILAALFFARSSIYPHVFPQVYGDKSYADGLVRGVTDRSIVYLFGTILSIAVICLIPLKRCAPLAYIGQRTLQIYVVHRVIRSCLTLAGFYALNGLANNLMSIVLVTAASLAALAMSLIPVFDMLFKPIMKLRWSFMLRD